MFYYSEDVSKMIFYYFPFLIDLLIVWGLLNVLEKVRKEEKERGRKKFLEYYQREVFGQIKLIIFALKEQMSEFGKKDLSSFDSIWANARYIQGVRISLPISQVISQMKSMILARILACNSWQIGDISEIETENCPVFRLIEEAEKFAEAAEKYFANTDRPDVNEFFHIISENEEA